MPSSNGLCPQCPYFRDGPCGQYIGCEGITTSSTILVKFNRKAQARRHRTAYCCADWAQCPIAQMHNRRYGYEG